MTTIPEAAALAALLAREHRGCWPVFAFPTDDKASRSRSAKHALELYGATAPLLDRRGGEWAEPVDFAVGLIREIADGYALLSNRWPRRERSSVPLPARASVERVIREHGVDAWAEELGHRLEMDDSPTRHELLVDDISHLDEEVLGQELSLIFPAIWRAYETFVAVRESPTGQAKLRSDDFRDAACREIWRARTWAFRARTSLGPAATEIAASMLFVAEAYFVDSWSDHEDGVAFPSLEYLREIINQSGADEWLRTRGVTLPAVQ